MVFRSMALGMILSVVAVALASLTLLPAVLVALGDRVLRAQGQGDDPDRAAEGRWARWTGLALRAPGPDAGRRPRPARSCSPRPPSACASACPAPESSTRAAPAATATTWSSSRSAPGAAAPAVRHRPAAKPPPSRRRPGRGGPERRRRPVVAPSRPPAGAPSSGSPRRPPSTPRRPPTWSGACGPTIGDTVPDAARRRPAAQNHDLTAALTGKAPLAIAHHHGRGLRAAPGRVPQPHHRPVVDRC